MKNDLTATETKELKSARLIMIALKVPPVKACAWCEQGKVYPHMTHGLCTSHFRKAMGEIRNIETEKSIRSQPGQPEGTVVYDK